MNRSEHLLSCLSEECDEVGQRVSKAQRFSLDEVQKSQSLTNRQRIEEELRDLLAVAYILMGEGIISENFIPNASDIENKKIKIEIYMIISRKQGALSE